MGKNTQDDKKYILDLAARERESGSLIYPDSAPGPSGGSPEGHEEPAPGPAPSPATEPQHVPPDVHDPPSPEPSSGGGSGQSEHVPSPPVPSGGGGLPVPQSPGELSWFQRHRTLLIVGGVLLLGFGLMGCCVVAFLIKSLGLFF